MAAKKPAKPKTATPAAAGNTPISRRSAQPAPAKPAIQSVQLPPLVLRPSKPQTHAWFGLFARKADEGALRDNLSAVKSGVLHEFETMSQQKGTPLTASPFRNVVLPPRNTRHYGAKFLVILLFLGLFGAIMMLAGQLSDPNRIPAMEASLPQAAVEPAAGPVAPKAEAATPVSREDISKNIPTATAITPATAQTQLSPVAVLASTKAVQGKNAIALTLTLGNVGAAPVPAGPLNITIADAAGRTLKQTTLVLETALPPHGTHQQTWTIPLDPGNKMDGFVAEVPLQALTVKAAPGA